MATGTKLRLDADTKNVLDWIHTDPGRLGSWLTVARECQRRLASDGDFITPEMKLVAQLSAHVPISFPDRVNWKMIAKSLFARLEQRGEGDV